MVSDLAASQVNIKSTVTIEITGKNEADVKKISQLIVTNAIKKVNKYEENKIAINNKNSVNKFKNTNSHDYSRCNNKRYCKECKLKNALLLWKYF